MLALIIGGAGSGKSEYAEKLAVRLANETGGPPIYLATMVSGGKEADARIRKHRKNRAGRGFLTIERYADLDNLQLEARLDESGPTVLLEDLGNLLGNEIFLPEGKGPAAVLSGIRHVYEQSANLVIVGNEVFSDGRQYDDETKKYLRELALIQRELAAEASLCAEIVCGCANILKSPVLRK
ncbi:MAG: bifunctional adenosylcobinamide kinase/adenosylcobinamide-phosphate guanylyltransferase [Eubacterium sp.]|nr:bifunctional adenosylcobinamide kinase/adenosylcobinamide-phosphate guanylyltransferase [Eubacterium sp.]